MKYTSYFYFKSKFLIAFNPILYGLFDVRLTYGGGKITPSLKSSKLALKS